MTLDPQALYRRANEILDELPPDGRSDEDRINDSASLARQELSENGGGPPVNIKALQVFMGHANISTTLDRYGHLLPGSEAEAAGLLDGYLSSQHERAEDQARAAGTGAFTGASLTPES